MSDSLTKTIDWLGHDSFRIRGSKIIYIDPWQIDGAPHDGDIVLITHSHYDHLSKEDIAKVGSPGVVVVAPASSAEKLDRPNATLLRPGEAIDLDGVHIETVRAYNTDKDFHPRSQDWVGYIVQMDGERIYHAGDTDVIDEMKDVDCDVALLPVSGTYVMTAKEAVDAAGLIQPRIAIPMHWGEIVGSHKDAEYFRDHAPCEVVIKDKVQ